MATAKINREQLEERAGLLQQCVGMAIVKSRQFAETLTEEQFLEVINQVGEGLGVQVKKPPTFPDYFYGKYYTMKNGKLVVGSSWEEMRRNILEVLGSDQGPRAKQVLDYLLNQPNYTLDYQTLKARFLKAQNTITKLLGYNIVQKVKDKTSDVTNYALYPELVPLIREIFATEDLEAVPIIRSDAAKEELEEIKKMDGEFDEYLEGLLEDRLEDVLDFGRKLEIETVSDYLRDMFGEVLYFDSLLSICQQYGMADTDIVNPKGGLSSHTGFHLALFGAPGTGKTFAVKEMVLGDPRKNVKAHGLLGRNRYCGGMTPAKFIRVGEAYQGRKFNFIVTEFNDWFKYRGMVEPLKIALEQGDIRFETKTESVGPYRFNSFFSTNYNTKVEGKMGYRVTVGDPNFNAIEDRMIVRLHRMTRERYDELKKSQRKLALGEMSFSLADRIRDHLVLVYAVQTEHALVKDDYKKKKIVARENIWDILDKASGLILDALQGEQLPFSIRLERKAIQLAGTLTLFSYFSQNEELLEIPQKAIDLAVKFYVEEAAVRAKGEVAADKILQQIL